MHRINSGLVTLTDFARSSGEVMLSHAKEAIIEGRVHAVPREHRNGMRLYDSDALFIAAGEVVLEKALEVLSAHRGSLRAARGRDFRSVLAAAMDIRGREMRKAAL